MQTEFVGARDLVEDDIIAIEGKPDWWMIDTIEPEGLDPEVFTLYLDNGDQTFSWHVHVGHLIERVTGR